MQCLSKALVHYCFLVFRRIGEYISLDLFYNVNENFIDDAGMVKPVKCADIP